MKTSCLERIMFEATAGGAEDTLLELLTDGSIVILEQTPALQAQTDSIIDKLKQARVKNA